MKTFPPDSQPQDFFPQEEGREKREREREREREELKREKQWSRVVSQSWVN